MIHQPDEQMVKNLPLRKVYLLYSTLSHELEKIDKKSIQSYTQQLC